MLRRLAISLVFAAFALCAACGDPAPRETPDAFRVRFETTAGDFIVEARQDWAPHGVDRFHELLTNNHFYRSRFFRVVPGFIAQFGVHWDYEVHRRWRGYFIRDDDRTHDNVRGTLAFAMSGPRTRATEMFINLADNPALDEQGFVPFARVVEGMDVVDKLYAGYGDVMPQGNFIDPGRVEESANYYLEERFPELDWIRSATILPVE